MEWTPAELASFCTAASAALVLLIKTICGGIHDSRCTSLRCGCCEMNRAVKKDSRDEESDDDAGGVAGEPQP